MIRKPSSFALLDQHRPSVVGSPFAGQTPPCASNTDCSITNAFMKRVAQAQTQQASRLPRAAVNEPQMEIIDLISDDDGSESDDLIEYNMYNDEEEISDAPEVPAQPQDIALGAFVDLLDPDLPRIAPHAHIPTRQPSPPHMRNQALRECVHIVADIFPGICFDHVSELYNKIAKSSESLIAHILDQMDNGILYPKAKDKAKDLKRKRSVDEIEAECEAALEEEENERQAQEEGTMKECACCFGEYPLNRMVHCDADEIHWFCRGCALRNAETEVGQSKYELCCMSIGGCEARFTISQRDQFLDEKTKVALERNEQEANLRLAGIENLASCPFCPFAAEYPPVEIDREFRCQAPNCEKVSCRLCNLESHIPNSCEENAKETGLSVRRRIEEAMSAALIRKCNKYATPFIKKEGCNKMRCTLKGCGNVQCYVCSKSCDYDHFDDQGRGGEAGNCPLFESVETRHDAEVSKAEKEALKQVRAEHPEYIEDDLKVKVSEDVKNDDERRKARDLRLNGAILPWADEDDNEAEEDDDDDAEEDNNDDTEEDDNYEEWL